ncbi:retrotransposon protein, putative, ty1-copia subclass [Tanacetum coccineum]
MAVAAQNINNTTIRSILLGEKLTGSNFTNWYRNLRIVLRYEKKLKFVEQPIGPAPDSETADPDSIDKYFETVNLEQEVACLMLSSMSPDLQKTLEKYNAFDMMKELKTMFEEQAKWELFETVKALHACKQEDGHLILISLKDYDQFVQNYNMHNMGKTIAKLHAMLKLHEKGILKKAETPALLAIRIKAIRSDRGGEYSSHKFVNHVKICGIVYQLTPPYTPQHNGLSKRRNLTLLDMVRSMMNITTLPKSFWGYALESVARILNMVPTKKVERTPYEIWHGKAHKLSYLRLWGCYLKETMGCYFYYPLENKIFVTRNAELFQNNLIVQEAGGSHGLLKSSGSEEELEFIQEEDTQPSENTSEEHKEVAPTEVKPLNVKVPIRRSARIPQVPDRYGFYVDDKEHELGDLNEPPNYKAALSDLEFDKWLEAMNTEMQTMKDNQVWILVGLPPNGRTVRSKWIFKKNTGMDGKNKRFDVEIKKIGFTQNPDEPCVYLKASGSSVAFLVLYVDDILLMGNNVTMLQEVKSWLCKCFSIKDLGEAAYILGIKIIRDRYKRLIALSQSDYLGWKTPRMGSIIEIHWTAVKAILKYLRNTKDMVLVYGAKPKAELKMRKFIDGLGGVMPSNKRPIEMLCDNEPTIAIANDPEILNGARHFQRKYHYILDVIQEREIVLKKVHTYDNVTYPFIKPMPVNKHCEHAMKIGIVLASSLM